jgi:hypothetical protein
MRPQFSLTSIENSQCLFLRNLKGRAFRIACLSVWIRQQPTTPRKSRIPSPGALHHVIVREIDRKRIFTWKGLSNGSFSILQKYTYDNAAAHTALILNGPDPIGIGVTYTALMAFPLMPCHRDGLPRSSQVLPLSANGSDSPVCRRP